MWHRVLTGIIFPFFGTSLGAACVYFMKRQLNINVTKALNGFAGGVMVAASVWSLILPAIDQVDYMGRFAFFPAVAGFILGILFLILVDRVTPYLSNRFFKTNGELVKMSNTSMTVFAVTLHNIPEGMAVGVAFAGVLAGSPEITLGGAMALSIGIGIQNFPEGAIISMPVHADGKSKNRSFITGLLSGVVEPVGAVITILFTSLFVPAMPYLLSFAAGAMIYVVVQELVPEMTSGERSYLGVIMFSLGFAAMMMLDVALG